MQVDCKNPPRELADHFDLSNLGKNCPYEPDVEIPPELKLKNAGVLGKFKDESAEDLMDKIIAFGSKMYAIDFLGPTLPVKKAKGIARNIVEMYINFHSYYKVLFESSGVLRLEMKTLKSIDHEINLLSINKISLSPFDDKRYINDSVNTIPFGHNAISQNEV